MLPFTTRRQTDPGPLLVDVRTRRAYHRRHIPGSHNCPATIRLTGWRQARWPVGSGAADPGADAHGPGDAGTTDEPTD
ncbi:rhodanese-like domain-containing protein, partial [Synechococcus sp. Tobar12-5m-g]|nr:rhodanese-like domain-containing protein [Synechococcus sp. Tobar12-5m-g]MCP9874476.1 rhodanese-like domain-containing protein [Synechococcus sp. Cruz CV-v-12]